MGKDGPPAAAKTNTPVMRSFASVFMHADAVDVVLMLLGLLGAMGDGFSTPVMLFITSRIFNDLGGGPGLLQEFSTKINEVLARIIADSSAIDLNPDQCEHTLTDKSIQPWSSECAEPRLLGCGHLGHGVPR